MRIENNTKFEPEALKSVNNRKFKTACPVHSRISVFLYNDVHSTINKFVFLRPEFVSPIITFT